MLLIGLSLSQIAIAQEGSPGTGIEYQVPGAVADSGNYFLGWHRYPAEQRQWLPMSVSTAYTRDILAGGKTQIVGARDGETWTAWGRRPNGTTITWSTIRFYSAYGAYRNCFVSTSWLACNTTSLNVLWYSNAQCQPEGTWQMRFYNNGYLFFTGQYLLLPQLPPYTVPLYNQVAYTDAYDTICRNRLENGRLDKESFHCDGRPNEVEWTIRGKGCSITSGAMVLAYHARANVSPATLNTWLKNNDGYDYSGSVKWDHLVIYAREELGVNVAHLGPQWDGNNLSTYLCQDGPQIIDVTGHFVTGTGTAEIDGEPTYLIHDPNGGEATNLIAAGYELAGVRRFRGPEYTYTDRTGIVIRFHSPGELLVTDPQGRVTGYDPTTGQSYSEIPGSSYGIISIGDAESGEPGPPTHDLDIRQPVPGEYLVDVVGTGTGTYVLEINAYDPELNPSRAVFADIPITAGAIHSYSFNYTKIVGDEIEPSGAFDGGGQRPRDVNKFLSFGSPGETRVHLPAGTTSYDVLIFYADVILPDSFSAVLDRADVTSWFNPVAGGSDLVSIPLQPGQNVLKLSVDGQLANRIATDTDRLVFLVPK